MFDILSEADWDSVFNVYKKWWNRELARPVIHLVFYGKKTDKKCPDLRESVYHTFYDLTYPIEKIVDFFEYRISTEEYVLDGYPSYQMDFGAGVNAEFLGCKAEVTPYTIWFESDKKSPKELKLKYKTDSPIYKRIIKLYKACFDRFGDSVIPGMTYIQNGIDIVCRFLDSSEVCLALYDSPEEIKRLISESHECWKRYRDDCIRAMGKVRGFTTWGGMLYTKNSGACQSDFSAMIGPRHFKEFILPELEMCINRSPEQNYYHLDGPGELAHLDMICGIKNLKCIQWVPPATGPREPFWPEVYKKIADSKKNIWLTGEIENIEKIAEQTGTVKGIYWYGSYHISEYDRIMNIANKFI